MMAAPTLQTYTTDLTNSCAYLDQLVSDQTTDSARLSEVISGIEYQLALPVVADSSEDLTSYTTSVSNAKTYLSTL